MKLVIKKTIEVEAKYLYACIGARYWEDATVNGVEDEEGELIPCREGDYWCPLIDLDSGQILNWEIGKSAKIHYKSCDDNVFKILGEDKNIIAEKEGYVIDIMCPDGEGYGDYVKMTINEEGFIKDFVADLSDFDED